jgi:alginate O-acetyltransferase complex protein AlgI
MTFNSFAFLIFFTFVFFVYYFLLNENTRRQNIFLLAASYLFYGLASWKIAFLLAAATIVYYSLGLAIEKAGTGKRKNIYSTFGVILGVGSLLYFKYTNFFITSFASLFEGIGLHTNWHTFAIILPIGISFYTFRLLSYVIDLKHGKYAATKDFAVFATYVAFFPCILSGPIDRPQTLIPQLQSKRVFNYDLAVDGCRQFLWGLFKKMVIADNCAVIVNNVYGNYQILPASLLFIAAGLYVVQMYADFSGYSEMAIGIGKVLGFRLTQNFNYPLFAVNIADYWRRWHISLTSWLTDYVFMPLNVRWRYWGKWGTILAIIITFELIGLWHGDNWTFALFGLYHGLLYIPLILAGAFAKKSKISTGKSGLPAIKDAGRMVLTFGLVTLGLILFRSATVGNAGEYIGMLFSKSLFSIPYPGLIRAGYALYAIIVSGIMSMLIVEWLQRDREHGLQIDGVINRRWLRIAVYYVIVLCIIILRTREQQFIYFQF